jgi:D-tyrosyl-tRNA(Tyr) deacylase
MEVTVNADAACDVVQAEIEARASGDWVDPHNGGIYSVLSSSNGVINTQRTTNPATSVGGVVYTDKQTFELTTVDGGCQIKGCSESQGMSVGDFSTNYCDMRNLFCGSSDGCVHSQNDFTHQEKSHKGSLGAGHDSSKCIVAPSLSVSESVSDKYNCPGSGALAHAWMEVTVNADATCDVVQAEIEARASGNWADPHNGGIYSVLSSSNGVINTQRTTNPATAVGGQLYTA